MQAIRFSIGTLGLGVVLVLCGASTRADAGTITNVTVTIGPDIFNAGSVGWQFPRTLQPGQDLVLTQSFNGPPNDTSSFNFDTSDVLGPGNFAQIAITLDGITTIFTDLNQVLNVRGIDTLSSFDNEAQNYGAPLIGPGYQVFLGYADNTHTGACGAWATSIGLNGSGTCFPAPFSDATFFDGAGGLNPPTLDQTSPNHCDETGQGANCYNAGVIRILMTPAPTSPVVPEPATMTLMLTGLAVMASRRYGRPRKRE